MTFYLKVIKFTKNKIVFTELMAILPFYTYILTKFGWLAQHRSFQGSSLTFYCFTLIIEFFTSQVLFIWLNKTQTEWHKTKHTATFWLNTHNWKLVIDAWRPKKNYIYLKSGSASSSIVLYHMTFWRLASSSIVSWSSL